MDKLKNILSASKKTLPLKPTLVFTVVFAIALTALGIGLPIYLTSEDSIKYLWQVIGNQIGTSSSARSLRYLHNAINFENYWVLQVKNGALDLSDNKRLLNLEGSALQSNRFFNWVSFSKPDGTFTAAYRLPNDKKTYGTIRTIDPEAKDKNKPTRIENYEFENDQWKFVEVIYDDYDPRTRPFWIKGVVSPDGGWTEPYKLKLTNEHAVACVRAQTKEDQLIGVWAIEFDARELNDFLNNLKTSFGGDVLFLASDGVIVASSIREFYNTDADAPAFDKIQSDKNNIIQEIWQLSLKNPNQSINIDQEGFFAHIEPFFTGEIPWHVITVVAKEKFLGPLQKQMIITIISGILLCALFAILTAAFFGHISKRLKKIADEMDGIGNFKFSPERFSDKPSFVKEVTLMNIATDRMKIGLNSFAKYVPINLVRQLIKSGQPAELSAKKNQMSVLFSDIVNFTTLSEQIPPEQLVDLLGQYLEIMSTTINKCRGEVDKFIGDSIMAIFGAPVALQNHAYQACVAALEMKKELESLNLIWAKENKPILIHKIGINTGTMIVGNIGASNRFEYTVLGDAVNLASRLEGLNKFYGSQILVGEDTFKATKEHFLFRPLDFVAVKGRKQPTLIYELLGLKGDNSKKIEDMIQKSEKALEFYRHQDFLKALELFNECNEALDNKDIASQTMAEKCLNYLKEPPPEDWAGATIMKEK
jgi:adenylate cyclase